MRITLNNVKETPAYKPSKIKWVGLHSKMDENTNKNGMICIDQNPSNNKVKRSGYRLVTITALFNPEDIKDINEYTKEYPDAEIVSNHISKMDGVEKYTTSFPSRRNT